MEDDLENLRLLAADLTDQFRAVSENFQIGLGTFVDKPTSPYSYVDPLKSVNPCLNSSNPSDPNSKCEASYSFRNEMLLSNNLTFFEETLGKLRVSSNIDDDEGGFDALMQVTACKERFGKWPIVCRTFEVLPHYMTVMSRTARGIVSTIPLPLKSNRPESGLITTRITC
eukprot:sb/3472260/